MKYLLDADSSIDHLNRAIDLFTALPNLAPRDLALSAASVIELYTGVYSSGNPRQAERDLRRFLRAAAVIPINQRVIHATAHLRARLLSSRQGIRYRAYDLIVAATGIEYGLIVVTSNIRDYRDISGVTTLDPRTGNLATH